MRKEVATRSRGKRAKVRLRGKKFKRVLGKERGSGSEHRESVHTFPEKETREAMAGWHFQTAPSFSLGVFCV